MLTVTAQAKENCKLTQFPFYKVTLSGYFGNKKRV